MPPQLEPLVVRSGCWNCPPKPQIADLSWDPDPGFGFVRLTRDGKSVLDYMHREGDPTRMTVQDFEDRAAGDPDHDWRFEIHGPMVGVVYQRHSEGRWVSVQRLEGFA